MQSEFISETFRKDAEQDAPANAAFASLLQSDVSVGGIAELFVGQRGGRFWVCQAPCLPAWISQLVIYPLWMVWCFLKRILLARAAFA